MHARNAPDTGCSIQLSAIPVSGNRGFGTSQYSKAPIKLQARGMKKRWNPSSHPWKRRYRGCNQRRQRHPLRRHAQEATSRSAPFGTFLNSQGRPRKTRAADLGIAFQVDEGRFCASSSGLMPSSTASCSRPEKGCGSSGLDTCTTSPSHLSPSSANLAERTM